MNSLQDILPHVGADSLDNCMAEVLPNLIPCLGSARVSVRKAAIQVKYSAVGGVNIVCQRMSFKQFKMIVYIIAKICIDI